MSLILTIIKCAYIAGAFVSFLFFGMWMLWKWASRKNLTPLWVQAILIVIVDLVISLLWPITVPFLWRNRKKA